MGTTIRPMRRLSSAQAFFVPVRGSVVGLPVDRVRDAFTSVHHALITRCTASGDLSAWTRGPMYCRPSLSNRTQRGSVSRPSAATEQRNLVPSSAATTNGSTNLSDRRRRFMATPTIRAGYLTVKSFVCASLPSNSTCNVYLPAGQPLGLTMWNSVYASPRGELVSECSSTTCPSWYVQRAVIFIERLPVVCTEAKTESFGPKSVVASVTRLSAPT